MVDTHYDLLSVCYACYLKNDYTKIANIARDIKQSGVKCIFANLYFMGEEEMKNELGENYYRKDVPVLEMFKIAKNILELCLPEIDFVYSIEGCDYLEENELEDLYKEGLRSITLVWNNENKYGSGNRSNKGLTNEGISLLNKAIDLGIGIDLSHANEKTFYDMIEVIKSNQNMGKDVTCYASHSNARRVCYVDRNLTDRELLAIKQVGGKVGVFSSVGFVQPNMTLDDKQRRDTYLAHIKYISNIIGVENVMLATDDMKFYADFNPIYNYTSIYNYSTISRDVRLDLLRVFDEETTNKIMYTNAYSIASKLNFKEIEKNK